MHEAARRRLLGQAAAALPAMLALPLLARPSTARAGNASKEDLHYQPPNENRRCADCVQFIAPANEQQPGTCQIVAGPISPDGWCMAFTPK